jgi:hypothetical protein
MRRAPTYAATAASVSATRATSGQEPTSGVAGIHTLRIVRKGAPSAARVSTAAIPAAIQ